MGSCAALTSLVVPSSNLLDDNMLSDMFSAPCQLERLSLAGCVRVHRVGPFMRQCSQMRALDLRCTGITDVDVALLVRHPHMPLQSGNEKQDHKQAFFHTCAHADPCCNGTPGGFVREGTIYFHVNLLEL